MNQATLHPTGKQRLAVIGVGGIAQTHLQVVDRVPRAELVAVVDVRSEAITAVAEAYKCHGYATVSEMLAAEQIDAAIVCTPPATHPEICCELLAAGVAVLCEKPMAVSRRDCQRMMECAAESHALLTMASKFRYVEDIVFVKQLIESGVLGDIVLFENTFTGYVDMPRRWNSQPEVSGGGVLIDNGTHSVDIVRYLLGPIDRIQAIEGKNVQSLSVEDTVRVNAKCHGGSLAAIDLSWSLHKPAPHFISVYGTAGTALVGWKGSQYKRNTDADWTTFGVGYDKHAAFSAQLENFLSAAAGEATLRVTMEDAMASVVAIEAAYWSINRHDFVDARVRAGDLVLAAP